MPGYLKKTLVSFASMILLVNHARCVWAQQTIKLMKSVGENGGYSTGMDKSGILLFAARIIGVLLGLLGIIFLVLILYAGYLWMTAGGDEQKVTKAKELIWRAVIGLIIILSASTISFFIYEKIM
jgi:hypothetical protein